MRSEVWEKFKAEKVKIEKELNVSINTVNKMLTYVGKGKDIEAAKQMIADLLTDSDQSKK